MHGADSQREGGRRRRERQLFGGAGAPDFQPNHAKGSVPRCRQMATWTDLELPQKPAVSIVPGRAIRRTPLNWRAKPPGPTGPKEVGVAEVLSSQSLYSNLTRC